MQPALIITGYGVNCEAETAHALRVAGAAVELIHLNDLLAAPQQLMRFGLVVFIGGFSFGDHLGAGRALAIRLKYKLADQLAAYVAEGGLALGICNGFQVLVKLGLLPGFEPFSRATRQLVTLSHNDSGTFRDDWVRLKVNAASPCVFTRGLDELELPIRHGEGKFLALNDDVLQRLVANQQIAYQYCDAVGAPTQSFPENPNGSVLAIAGLCDPTGRIFGTMPHPEACVIAAHHPGFHRAKALGQTPPPALGIKIFENAVAALREGVPA